MSHVPRVTPRNSCDSMRSPSKIDITLGRSTSLRCEMLAISLTTGHRRVRRVRGEAHELEVTTSGTGKRRTGPPPAGDGNGRVFRSGDPLFLALDKVQV